MYTLFQKWELTYATADMAYGPTIDGLRHQVAGSRGVCCQGRPSPLKHQRAIGDETVAARIRMTVTPRANDSFAFPVEYTSRVISDS